VVFIIPPPTTTYEGSFLANGSTKAQTQLTNPGFLTRFVRLFEKSIIVPVRKKFISTGFSILSFSGTIVINAPQLGQIFLLLKVGLDKIKE